MKLVKIILLLVPLMLSANNGLQHKKIKRIHKKFNVNSDALMGVSNKYGDINISTWDKNVIEFDIKIEVEGNDLDDVEKKIEGISVDFDASKSQVDAKTKIKDTSTGWSFFGIKRVVRFKINYYIKVPKNVSLNLKNKYGNIEVPIILGKSEIRCDYGNLYAESLKGKTEIELNYSSNTEIYYIRNGRIDADYSDVEVRKSKVLKLEGDYTKYDIGKTNNINFNLDYGGISVDKANTIEGNSDYTGIHIGTVKENLIIDTDYGSLRVDSFECKNTTSEISSDYASIKISIPEKQSVLFEVKTSYAGVRYPKTRTKFYKQIKDNSSKYYEGVIGDENTKTKLIINSDYGKVSIR